MRTRPDGAVVKFTFPLYVEPISSHHEPQERDGSLNEVPGCPVRSSLFEIVWTSCPVLGPVKSSDFTLQFPNSSGVLGP
jgi:hypothetical protein